MTSPMYTEPLSIRPSGPGTFTSRQQLSPHQVSPPPGTSPPSLLGSSPPSRSIGSWEKQAPHAAAKKWWKRLQYDPSLDATTFQVGYLKSVQQAERKSGAEAWSMRVQKYLAEVPYHEFQSMFGAEDVPFHRIMYFKQNGEYAWESEQYRKSLADAHGSLESSSRASSGLSALMEGISTREPSATGVAPVPEEEQLPPSFTALPEECWLCIMMQLPVRDLCSLAKTCGYCRTIVFQLVIWRHRYTCLFGSSPNPSWDCGTVRRLCRHSELKAARWLEAPVRDKHMTLGFPASTCLRMDDSKVLSADGSVLRLWSHGTGRKIATLPGHTGRVRSVSFHDELIVSADSCCVKVWNMDDLKCMRTLRGHDGDITRVMLVGSLPVSCCEDGNIRLWDVLQSSPVETLEAGDSVYDLDVHLGTGHLVSAGWYLDLWDLNTAQRLNRLASTVFGDSDLDMHPTHNYSHVSYSGDLLVAGRAGEVALWDVRTGQVVGTMVWTGARSDPHCMGVQLDDWKLALAMSDGSGVVQVHDIRAASSLQSRVWRQPVMKLRAPAAVNCFEFQGSSLVAALDNNDFIVWNFNAPSSHNTWTAIGPLDEEDHLGDSVPGCTPPDKGKKKKPAKVTKKETRYPKRKTK